MSSKSKESRSGLGTFKRDFSSRQTPPSSQGEEIPWSSSPARSSATVPKPPARTLTGAELRLQKIQEALAGHAAANAAAAAASSSTSGPSSSLAKKRPSAADEDQPLARPVAKRRQLPPDWQQVDPISKGSMTNARSSSKSSDALQPANGLAKNAVIPHSLGEVKKLAKVFLSREQTQILKLVEEGASVFYTGSAGTGKSVLLREIIKTLRRKYNKSADAVAITASTGIAACNIGGVTIHSFAGIGLGAEAAEELYKKVRKNKKASSRWLRTQVLIIDEVSMVDGELFDKLAYIASKLKKSEQPFGGIQVIVTGDFFQLPPVTKGSATMKFAFEADMWKATLRHTFNLTHVFRQSDQTFVNMLNEMRFGQLTQASIRTFRSLSREIQYDDGIVPTELFPRREDVERSNWNRMAQLQTQTEQYVSSDQGILEQAAKERMLANFMAPQNLQLRIDAQVMLIKNVDETLVNGTIGRVVRFVDPAVYASQDDPEYAFGDGCVIGSQHSITGIASAKRSGKPMKKFPVVEFVLANQGGRRRALVMPDVWKVELPNGEVQVSRSQLPLILSWAMSIHKSQGQTLDRVKVDLGKVFEKGQAYVALSRATSLEGLQVLNFDPSKVQAHPKVVSWSKTLSTISEST